MKQKSRAPTPNFFKTTCLNKTIFCVSSKRLFFVTSFFSVGRSMSHIKNKYGFISAIITHYGITIAGLSLYIYIKYFTGIKII